MVMALRHILVVDDEYFLTHLLQHTLQRAGYSVSVADNGQAAYELAVREPPALVVTDYQMPRWSGLELCIALKTDARTAAVPAIMLTGRGHRITPTDLAKTNIRHLMPKPFSAKDLTARVIELIGEAQATPLERGAA